MLDEITCPHCHAVNHLNPKKHRYRPKYCVSCRSPLPTTYKVYSGNPAWEYAKRLARKARERFKKSKPVSPMLPPEYVLHMARQLFGALLATAVCKPPKEKKYH